MGKIVGEKYQLIGHLGGGAVSDVSLARLVGQTNLVVLKRLKLGTDADPHLLAQFADETRLSLRLKAPNIVDALAAGEDAEGPFLVFEYLEGQPLGRLRARASRRVGGLPRPIALNIIMAVTTALAYAHAALDDGGKPLRVIHRDVSPDNIIVTYAGETKVIDFSVATAKAPTAKERSDATKGNIAYMAPEQGKSAIKPDERADVFATGIVLWELLASKRLWEGLSDADVLARLANDEPLPRLRDVVPDMPEELDAICAKALAKVRDERFDSAVEMHEAIEKATKKLGLVATSSEVAAFVTSLFEDEREKMRATVAEALTSPADSARALPVFPEPGQSSSRLLAAPPSDPDLAAAAAAARVVEVIQVEKPEGADRRFTLAIAGAVAVAFAVVAVVAMTQDGKGHDDRESAKRAVATRPRGPASAAPEPSASAYVEPTEVTVEISVTPRTAQLIVDGAKVPSSYYRTKVAPGKFVHEVRAEAPGHEPRTVKVLFDRDRTVEIALTPKPYAPGAAGRPAAAPSAAPPSEPAPQVAPPTPSGAGSAPP